MKIALGLVAAAGILVAGGMLGSKIFSIMTDEVRVSGIRSAYIVLVARYAQMIQSGHIYGESASFPDNRRPVWQNRPKTADEVDCSAEITSPDYQRDSLPVGGIRNFMLFAVGPNSTGVDGRGSIAIVYPGVQLDFDEILESPRIEEIFAANGQPSGISVDAKEIIPGDQVQRDDERDLYVQFIEGRDVQAFSKTCVGYAYTTFTFTE
jgi:hypothetical protein